jgi:hypothetical protein
VLIKLESAMTLWGFGAPTDEVDGAIGFLEVCRRLVRWIFTITPGRVVSVSMSTGAFRAAGLVPVIVVGSPGVFMGHTVEECMTIAHGMVCVLVPRTLAIKELIQVLLVEEGALSGWICYGDGVLRAMFAILFLG